MNVKEAKEIIKDFEKGRELKKFKNPYGEVGVSKKIVDKLK